ncbi:Chitin synthase, class 3 [Entophlyctis sp. JEL0112]|nr:Chitin synthase, class 3 [Entophlyctis sp. JEL0112]
MAPPPQPHASADNKPLPLVKPAGHAGLALRTTTTASTSTTSSSGTYALGVARKRSSFTIDPSLPIPQPTLPNIDSIELGFLGAAGSDVSLLSRHDGNNIHNGNNDLEYSKMRHHSGMEPVPVFPGRTLSRPIRDRTVNFNSLGRHDRIPNNSQHKFTTLQRKKNLEPEINTNAWVYASWVLTCCFPSGVLSSCFGKENPLVQQAWREKVALCMIIASMMAFVAFLTFGFQNLACPSLNGQSTHLAYLTLNTTSDIAIHGGLYSIKSSSSVHPAVGGVSVDSVFRASKGADVSLLFPPAKGAGSCSGLDTQQYPLFPCIASSPSGSTIWPNTTVSATLAANSTSACHTTVGALTGDILEPIGDLVFGYSDIASAVSSNNSKLMIYGGFVLDVSLFYNDAYSSVLGSTVKSLVKAHIGKDASHAFAVAGLDQTGMCLVDYLKIASVDSIKPACLASTIVVYISLVIILAVVFSKFLLALYFTYVIGWRLGNNRAYQRAMQDLRRRKTEYGRSGAARFPAGLPQSPRSTDQGSNSGSGSGDTQSVRGLARFASDSRLGMTAMGPMTSEARRTAAHARESMRDAVDPSRSWQANFGFMEIAPPPLDSETQEILNDPTLMHCIAMVPCYSEGRESLKSTLDSIAGSYYPSTHKVLFVIADGIVKGSENDQSTPDILIDMIEVDSRFRKDDPRFGGEPEAFSYVAIADGANRKNYAKVYAGWYKYDAGVDRESSKNSKRSKGVRRQQSSASFHDDANAYARTMRQRKAGRLPMLLVVKCGNEDERDPNKPAAKPGNRGKRDSQVILMNFLCKVLFDDRMTELEANSCLIFDIFFKLFTITGVNPEKYEAVLMVDADTRIYPDSMSHMVACLIRDDRVMGLCGETKILNKWESWVTMIQVFEYYISHHMSKAFESVFGGVTCLPGCFSMYRIKSPKGPNGFWVPILANPDVVEEYSEHIVDTLHKKNLLLLGEDRFLTTMMLRQFPKRRMVYVPPAICKTVVPNTFKVLLSQRRRWINSTIHNLMELLLVKDLCGTFCISMQFVIFMDLVGTCVLPAAISFTITVIVLGAIGSGDATLPLILLAVILGLPAVLIVMTVNRPIYVFWMLVYLVSLPIWNFVLPLYAFWHFDDFSWGATRKVTGEDTKHDHSARDGEFDGKGINMKRWSEWVQLIRAEHERQTGRSATATPVPYGSGFGSSRAGSMISEDSMRMGQGSGSWNPSLVTGGGPVNEWAAGLPPPSVGMYGAMGMAFGPPPASGLPFNPSMPPPMYPPPPAGAYKASPLTQFTPAQSVEYVNGGVGAQKPRRKESISSSTSSSSAPSSY